MVPSKRSPPRQISRIGVRAISLPLSSNNSVCAPSASWPSRKIVAVTAITSPATAFTGTNSPPKLTAGDISVMGMRVIKSYLSQSLRYFPDLQR